MGGSVKSDESIFSINFCAMAALYHSKRDAQVFLIDLTYTLIHTVISRSLIFNCWRWSQTDKGILALGSDNPPGYALPVGVCNKIGHGLLCLLSMNSLA